MMERSDRSSEIDELFGRDISSVMEMNELFESAMKGQWDKVFEANKNPGIQEAKITKSKDTVLNIAVTTEKSDIVLKLVGIIGENASKILNIKNKRGNTALHLAAALGNVDMCNSMAARDSKPIASPNNESETPLFLAARHGKKTAFHLLHSFNKENDTYLCRKSNGDTILHSAISGEYFSLAFEIIQYYPGLLNSVNENGQTPPHVLASKPDAFKSGCRFGLFDRIIYHCIFADLLEDKQYNEDSRNIKNSRTKSDLNYPTNYETCIRFFKLIKASVKVLIPIKTLCQADDEENPPLKCNISQGGTNRGASSNAKESESSDANKESIKEEDQAHQEFYPPRFLTLMYHALLVVLGLGIWRINHIAKKKEGHKWANLIMNKLVLSTTTYKNENTGRNARNSGPEKQEDTFLVPETPPNSDNDEITEITNVIDSSSSTSNHNKDGDGSAQRPKKKMKKPELLAAKLGITDMVDRFLESYPAAVQELSTSQKSLVLLIFDKKQAQQSGRKETPILVAAKMGVTEMVEKILNTYPVAIHDLDSDNKNTVLLAVENRQTRMYKLLLNRKSLGDSVFRQVDNEGNSALHLAATFGEYRRWPIPGAALQMQWEIKWYKFVKKSMPRHFFVRHNSKRKTPKEILVETHKDLVKDGSEWLTKTSESCSVVAALIAAVTFATSATMPGGMDQGSGKPILKDEPVFDLFAISSLVALCFSVTALVFFL